MLDEISTLYYRICSFESALSDAKWNKGIHKKLGERFGTDILMFFDLSDDGGKVAFQGKCNAITARKNVCGSLVILTTSEDSWDTVLQRYMSRNDIEFDFRQLKFDLEGGAKCLQTDGVADGLIFVQFVSLILWSEILRRMSESGL